MHFVRKLAMASFPIIAILAMWTLPAQAAPATTTPLCAIHTQSSVVEMGFGPSSESSFADVIVVECRPIYSQNTVTIDATQLSNLCHGTLSWATPPFPPSSAGAQFTVTLDNEGSATAVVWGGPSCAPGTALITASLNAPPFTTVRTHLTLLSPRDTPHGVTAHPSTEVEDATYSSVATVIQVEFPSVQAEKFVIIKSQELFSRCASSLSWFGPEEVPLGTGPSTTVQLDNNGNAFAVAIAGPSCASGTSTVVAELTTVPYTTFTTTFTILSPRPTCTPTKC